MIAPWHSLRGRLLLLALLVEAVMLAILVGNSLRLLHEAMGNQARAQAEQIAPILSAALVAPLAQYDYATVQAVIDESHAIRGIDYLAVMDASGAIVATSGLSPERPLPAVDEKFSLEAADEQPRYDVALPILMAGQRLGTLQFGLDLSPIVVARHNLLTQGVAIAFSELFLSAALLTLLGLLMTRQLSLLTEASLKVAKGELALAQVPEGDDDVGRLGAALNVMSQAIAERIDQLKAIFDLSPDGFVSFDAARRVQYASPAFFNMTGLGCEELVGLDEAAFSARLSQLCSPTAAFPGVPALKVGAAETALLGGKSTRHLIELAAPPHLVLEVGLRLSATRHVSQILYFHDVTYETEVDRMKSEFLSHAAHELRTPMASIYGYSELMLAREFDDAERKEFLGTIHRQSELMISIINELLDLVRIEERRGKDFAAVELDIGALMREVVTDFGVPKGREPATLAAPDDLPLVRGDRSKLMQAMRNVLSNAYKYSPAGGAVTVAIRQRRREGNKPAQIGVSVRDQGIGMTPEQARRVCERFYRVDTSGRIPGTGLGMSIVKEILSLHGGEVEFDSEVGVGTTVTLWLPVLAEVEP